MPHLVVREPGRVTFSLPLGGPLRLGRHERSDLVLSGTQVSRHHAEIAAGAEGWMIRDLGSTHGTLVNGEKITARALKEGDRIQIGSALLLFHGDDEPEHIVHQQITEAAPPPLGHTVDPRLKLFYELGHAIGAIGDTGELLGRLLGAILDVLGCERALAGLWEAERGSFRSIQRQRGGPGREEIVVSRTIVDATMSRRERVIVQRASGRAAPETFIRTRVQEAMAVPLATHERLFGLLYVDDREKAARFTPEDLDFLASLGHLVAAALDSAERYQRASAVAEAIAARAPLDEIVGESAPMQRLKALIRKYGAAPGAHVLIQGESGTGKELVAHALHAASPRAGQPFVALNCAAIPEGMIESELFGHEKGAFTGAVRDKKGKFALAHGGTLFLDEIGDLNLASQAKVLRAIQEGEVQPVGSERVLRVNVRILAATHKALAKELAGKRFREDLYYRLNVLELPVPPLRERGEDIALLAQALLETSAASVGKRLLGFTPAALAALRHHPWPGNVRELKNEVERAAIITESTLVDVVDLSPRIAGAFRGIAPGTAPQTTLAERFAALEPMERQLVEDALKAARGNLSEAARLLGITRIMLKRRVERFALRARDDDE